MAEKVDIKAENVDNEMVNDNKNGIATSSCSIDSIKENAKMCIAAGCNNQAVKNPEWDNEYCSISCSYIYCKATFEAWISNNKILKSKNEALAIADTLNRPPTTT